MKDLHTNPDEHLEARLTALALGEASPFEAAELEALCSTKPELQVFLNRTKALHSLLLETPPSSSDQFWKLSPERRAKLDPIIGPNISTHSNKDSSIRRAAFRAAFGIAAVLTVTVFIKRFIFPTASFEKSSVTIVGGSEFKMELPRSRGMIIDSNEEIDFMPPGATGGDMSGGLGNRSSDTGLVMSDREGDEKMNERSSGILENQKKQKAFKSPQNKRVFAEGASSNFNIEAKESELFSQIPQTESTASPTPTAAPSAKKSEPLISDVTKSGIGSATGYADAAGGGGGQSDMSNTALALDELASNDSRQRGGFEYKEKELEKDSLKGAKPRARAEELEKSTRDNSLPTLSSVSDGSGTLRSYGSSNYAGKLPKTKSPSKEEASLHNTVEATPNTRGKLLAEVDKAWEESVPADGQRLSSDRSALDTNGTLSSAGASPTPSGQVSELAAREKATRANPAITNVEDKDFDQRRLESGKVVDTKSDYYRAAYDNTIAKNTVDGDKNQGLGITNGRVQNGDPFADNRPTDDPFAAAPAGDPFASSTSESIGQIADVAEGGLKRDLSTLTKGKDEMTLNFGTEIIEFDGYIGYGSPIDGKPKQIDITTKHVEIAQGNNTELGFGWFNRSENQKADVTVNREFQDSGEYEPAQLPYSGTTTTSSGTLNIPVTPATPSEFEARLTGSEGETLAILGDIPVLGRLFQTKPPSLTDLSEELSSSQEVFSTFSLNISDASFQLASAAIAKGERPDPASIKPEQFYNAVDYGDPAPSASEPVSAAIDQTAHPVIPGRNLVRVAVRTASAGRSAAQPLRLTLLVDQSGSMVRADRRAAMETALASLATLLTENDQVTVIGFSRTPHLLAEALPGNEASKLSDLINQDASEGGTNLEQAINLATEQALRHRLDGAQNRIVLFTDGAANLGDADPERLSNKIETLRQQGLSFDIAGIGTNDVNDKLLSDLARHGNGRYYLVGEKTANTLATQLAGTFRPAAENVKIQVKLNPQRVGNYKLIGFEKDRLKTEDFRNDTVDAAELAADESGVAIYQVETLPQGTGEIGEVSIRFRDTASDEMVERKWTIPYDASAPSFDKANPKTQLATLALLAAQKLQPGPLADAIDFSNYSETIAKLKQANANSSKTQQLLDLINKLK